MRIELFPDESRLSTHSSSDIDCHDAKVHIIEEDENISDTVHDSNQYIRDSYPYNFKKKDRLSSLMDTPQKRNWNAVKRDPSSTSQSRDLTLQGRYNKGHFSTQLISGVRTPPTGLNTSNTPKRIRPQLRGSGHNLPGSNYLYLAPSSEVSPSRLGTCKPTFSTRTGDARDQRIQQNFEEVTKAVELSRSKSPFNRQQINTATPSPPPRLSKIDIMISALLSLKEESKKIRLDNFEEVESNFEKLILSIQQNLETSNLKTRSWKYNKMQRRRPF